MLKCHFDYCVYVSPYEFLLKKGSFVVVFVVVDDDGGDDDDNDDNDLGNSIDDSSCDRNYNYS